MSELLTTPYIHTSKCDQDLETYFKEHVFQQQHLDRGESFSSLPENSVGFLQKGELKVYFSDDIGKERLMFILSEKTPVYTMTLDSFGKRIVASSESLLLYISEDAYFDFLLLSKSHLSSFVQTFIHRYSVALQHCVCSVNQSSRAKVYTFIYQMALSFGQPEKNGRILVKKMPKLIDISSITGVHRSNVTTYFKELEKNGLLTKQKNNYLINDMAQLERLITDLEH